MKKILLFTLFFVVTLGFIFSQAKRVYISKLEDIGLVCKTSFKRVMIDGKLKSDDFVEVIYVRKDSIAYNLGINVGDLILSVNNQPVLSEFQVLDLINFIPKNVDVVLNILRNGKRMDIVLFKKVGILSKKGKKNEKVVGKIPIEEGINTKVNKIEKPESSPIIYYVPGENKEKKVSSPTTNKVQSKGKGVFLLNFYLGMDFLEVNSQLGKSFNVDRGSIFVLKVYKNSPAESAGLRAGDFILTIDGNKIKNVDFFTKYVMANIYKKKEFVLVVKRGKELMSLKIKPLIRNEKVPYHM